MPEHEQVEVDDQWGRLEMGEVLRGGHDTAVPVDPADQGLVPRDVTPGEVDDRLEPGGELATVQPLHDLAHELEVLLGLDGQVLVEEADTVAAVLLGPAHRQGRVADEAVCVGTGCVAGDADAHGRMDLATGQGDGLLRRDPDPFGQAGDGGDLRQVRDHDDELGARPAREEVVVGDDGAQRAGPAWPGRGRRRCA